MLFVSRIRPRKSALSARTHFARQLQLNNDGEHKAIWDLFGNGSRLSAGRKRCFLFRREQIAPYHYTLLSTEEPDQEHGFWDVTTAPFQCPENGSIARFSLRANPVRKRGKRKVGLVEYFRQRDDEYREDEEILYEEGSQWLLDRAEKLGLAFLDAAPVSHHRYQFNKLNEPDTTVTLSVIDFSGVARVTDQFRLRKALIEGVGGGQAYGCGLLALSVLEAR